MWVTCVSHGHTSPLALSSQPETNTKVSVLHPAHSRRYLQCQVHIDCTKGPWATSYIRSICTQRQALWNTAQQDRKQCTAHQRHRTKLLLAFFLCLLSYYQTELPFLVWLLLQTHCRCGGLLLHLITLRHTTVGRTLLDGWSAVADTSTWQHTTFKREKYPCPVGIRTRNPSKRAAADPRLRMGGHWDRPEIELRNENRTSARSGVWFMKCPQMSVQTNRLGQNNVRRDFRAE